MSLSTRERTSSTWAKIPFFIAAACATSPLITAPCCEETNSSAPFVRLLTLQSLTDASKPRASLLFQRQVTSYVGVPDDTFSGGSICMGVSGEVRSQCVRACTSMVVVGGGYGKTIYVTLTSLKHTMTHKVHLVHSLSNVWLHRM